MYCCNNNFCMCYEDRDTAPGFLDRVEDIPAGDAMLTVVFLDGRTASVPIMVPTKGEAVVMRDGILLAEDKSMRCFSFPNVSHWWTDSA